MSQVDAAQRKPVWLALSVLYLDTELTDEDYKRIASVLHEAKLSWTEIQTINREEVAPVLVYNLLGVAGEWAGFDEEWLVAAIARRQNPPTLLGSRQLWGHFIKWLLADALERLRRFYTY